jgi:hypothetical protein
MNSSVHFSYLFIYLFIYLFTCSTQQPMDNNRVSTNNSVVFLANSEWPITGERWMCT